MLTRSYLDLLEESFPGIKNTINRSEGLGFPWEESELFLKEEKGEVVCHAALLEAPILIEGQWHNMGAMHAICTKASHRNRGFASHLLEEALLWSKKRSSITILFTEIPQFYERLSFRVIEEHRFHLPARYPKGSCSLRPVIAPQDNDLFRRCFSERDALSHRVWIKDNGAIACFNALFATYPTYWSLYYSDEIDGLISYFLENKTLHLLDIIAKRIPSFDLILSHLPQDIDEIYFYFSPDRLTDKAIPKPYLYDKSCLMVHGMPFPVKPFMISPLSRC